MVMALLDSSTNYESGDGILVRLTLQVVGTGTSRLELHHSFTDETFPGILASGGISYLVAVSTGTLVVGSGDCESASPPPLITPTKAPPPTGAPPVSTPGARPLVRVAIDANPTGNGDNTVGVTESCNSLSLQVGETIEIDLVIRDVPLYQPGVDGTGMTAFTFNLHFDPGVLAVELIHEFRGPTILQAGGFVSPSISVDYAYGRGGIDPPPGNTGDVAIAVSDVSSNFESGDGVLTRVTAKAVGPGVSTLTLTDHGSTFPSIYPAQGQFPYLVELTNGALAVGGDACPASPPSIRQTPPPSPPQVPVCAGSYTPCTPSFTSTRTLALKPTDASTVTPAGFPRAGGVPGSGVATPIWLALGAGALAVGAGFALARRRWS